MIATSGMAPKGMQSPEALAVAIQMGLEVGMMPMQAVQNIAVINGRPSIWGDAALALVRGSGLLEDFREWFTGTEGADNWTAHCLAHRRGDKEGITETFSLGDAKRAKLVPADPATPWAKYPQRMLKMRARSWALRDNFTDVLKGLQTREEAGDIVVMEATPDGGFSPVDVPPTAKSLKDKLKAKNGGAGAAADPAGTKAPPPAAKPAAAPASPPTPTTDLDLSMDEVGDPPEASREYVYDKVMKAMDVLEAPLFSEFSDLVCKRNQIEIDALRQTLEAPAAMKGFMGKYEEWYAKQTGEFQGEEEPPPTEAATDQPSEEEPDKSPWDKYEVGVELAKFKDKKSSGFKQYIISNHTRFVHFPEDVLKALEAKSKSVFRRPLAKAVAALTGQTPTAQPETMVPCEDAGGDMMSEHYCNSTGKHEGQGCKLRDGCPSWD